MESLLNKPTNQTAKKTGTEHRKSKREIFHHRLEVMTIKEKNSFKAASYDLSEGGIRIVANVNISDKDWIIKIENFKLLATVVHKNARHSSMMNSMAYYYGLQFRNPISPEIKKKLLLTNQLI